MTKHDPNRTMIHVRFLGTGPAEAIPRTGHRDALCQDARRPHSKSHRLRSAALVSFKKTNILIDAGPDIALQLRNAKPARLDAVLLTHGHADAVGGLKQVEEWLRIHGQEGVPLVTDHRTAEQIQSRIGIFSALKPYFLKPYKPIILKELIVRPFPVRHAKSVKIKTHGFLFGSCAYASDFYDLPQKTKTIMRGINTGILDAAMWFGHGMPTHMTTGQTLRLATELNIENLILTQSGHTYPPHEEAEKIIQTYAKKQNTPFPKTVQLAYDGLQITIPDPGIAKNR